MTLEKAIKGLKAGQQHPTARIRTIDREIQLGIEALRHVKAVRVFSRAEKPPLLPGETKE